MPTYHFTTHELLSPKMSPQSFSLPTSKRSGHPIFPITDGVPPKDDHPTREITNNSPPGIDISPYGTWKPVAHDIPLTKIETLDLTDRFGYQPAMKAKTRPRNALKKGFKPSKISSLPMKRQILEISSGEDDDDDDDDDEDGDKENISEPSPLHKKHARITTFGNHARRHDSVLEEIQAAVGGKNSSPIEQAPVQAMGDETTLPHLRTFPAAANDDARLSPHPSVSSETIQVTTDIEYGNGTGHELPPDEYVPNGNPFADDNAFATSQPAVTNHATVASTQPFTAEQATTANNDFATATPIGLNPNAGNPSLPVLTPHILNHTILRVYRPDAGVVYLPNGSVYVPFKLRSCTTIQAVFSAVTKVLYDTDRPIFLLTMKLDGAEAGGKGVIAVQADVEDSWECFLEEVQRWEGWKDGGVGDLGVDVHGYVNLARQGI